MSAQQLWSRLEGGDDAARNTILTNHLSLVHHVARGMMRTMSARFEYDELVSFGTIGLMQALESFESARGLAFSTYAVPRIRGAILDQVRSLDDLPRSVRRRERGLNAARESTSHKLGRAATDIEVAAEMGVDAQTVWRWDADARGGAHVSLDSVADEGAEDGRSLADMLVCQSGESIEDQLTREQEAVILAEALGTLRAQERTVLALYYFEELKLHEIASILGVTESRASQVRAKALGKLRSQLGWLRAEMVA